MKKNLLLFCVSCFFSYSTHASLIDSGVTVNDLSHFSLDTLGSHDKLAKNLWHKSNPETLFPLIDKIGTTKLSPASKKILITLLTQDSTGFDFINTPSENLFLIKRIEALVRLGAFKEAIELIDLIPMQSLNQNLFLIKANIHLALGHFEEVEKIIQDMDQTRQTDETRINLFLEKEERNKAVLSYEIYRENQEINNPLFSALAENILLELDTNIPNEETVNIEHIFLISRLKNQSFDLEKQSDGIKKIFVNLPAPKIEDRINYAEKINLTADELASIYQLPLLNSNIDKNHLRRAEIYQKIKAETDPFAKAEWLKTFIKIAIQDKLGLSLAPLIIQELDGILPQQEYKDLAFYAAQIYILHNNLEKANEWYQILKNEKDDSYQKQRLLLIPGMQKLGAGIPDETESLLNHFCSDLTKENCSQFWQKSAQIFYETLPNTKPNRPPLMIFDYMTQDQSEKTGENLIKAIFDLNDETVTDKYSLLFFIKQNYPQDISLPLELEGTLYQ